MTARLVQDGDLASNLAGLPEGYERSVSVIIPHYGDPSPALRLLDHIRDNHSIKEVVVVDDCSPMSLPERSDINMVRRSTNGGYGAAVNSGARMSTGDFLLVLNTDIRLQPGDVDALVTASSAWQPAITGPAIADEAGRPQFTGRHFPRPLYQFIEWLHPLARWRSTRRLHESVGHDTRAHLGSIVTVDWLVGAALLIPRADFMAAGGFDERFFMNSEEVDLQWRLRQRHIPSVYVGSIQVVHEGGGSSDPALRRQWLVESRRRYAKKRGWHRRLQAALTVASGVNLLWNVARSLTGKHVEALAVARTEFRLIWREI